MKKATKLLLLVMAIACIGKTFGQKKELIFWAGKNLVLNTNKNNKTIIYSSLPKVGAVAGEFYIGECTTTKNVQYSNMSYGWQLECEKEVIAFTIIHAFADWSAIDPWQYNKDYIYLDNNRTIKRQNPVLFDTHNLIPYDYRFSSWHYIPIQNYESEKITIISVNMPNGGVDHIYEINYTLPINVAEAKKYCTFYKAKNASLKDAINYLKDSPYDEYRQEVENEIVNSKINSIADFIYCHDNYPKLSDRLEEKLMEIIASLSDCDTYLKYYPANKQIDDKTYEYVSPSNEISDCETYLKHFPNGSHKAAVTTQKNEIACYNAAKRGGKAECTTYLTKYPNGRFTSEIQSKKDDIVKEEQRQAQIKTNSNKGIWKLGNKLCNCTSDGIIMATLDQWNEDHSSFKGIIAASPGGLFQGDLLQKGNQLWFETKGWHKCLDDEVEFALSHDKSLEAEQLMKAKKMKFAKGTVVAHTYYSRGWLFSSSYRVTAKVDDWNDDYTRMKIQIIKTDGLDYIDGESIYEGKYIWVSPIGWE